MLIKQLTIIISKIFAIFTCPEEIILQNICGEDVALKRMNSISKITNLAIGIRKCQASAFNEKYSH
jgi:hypothetical protein